MKKIIATSLFVLATIALLGLSRAAFAADRVVHVAVHADSEHPGMEAFKAMDGNPGTIWHSIWRGAVTNLPHEIVVDLGKSREITGFTHLTRPPGCKNGNIKDYEVYLSERPEAKEPLAKGTPVAKGTFEKEQGESVVKFDRPVKGRYFRLRVLSNVTGNPTWSGIGELTLHCKGVKFVGESWAVARGELRLSKVIGSHMVLQRDVPPVIWGWGKKGQDVMVALDGKNKATVKVDEKGAWQATLKPVKADGKTHKLVVTQKTGEGEEKIELEDILIGDVWIGSGQSNMAGGVAGYARGDKVLATLAAGTYPHLRLCYGNGGPWQLSTPQTNRGFSALLFSFGQRLQKDLDVPIGLIQGAVGGTPSGRWLTDEMVAKGVKRKGFRAANGGDLYRRFILPVAPYRIRGVLWDQGESGTAIPGLDQFTTMGALIRGWRDAWGQGEFPFLYVQKPSGGGCAWDKSKPTTRMAQDFAALPAAPQQGNAGGYRAHHVRIMQHPGTAMVTARDLGSGTHPLNKSGYGHRAAQVALGFVYKQEVEIYGPIYASHKVEGDKIRVQFKHIGGGLATKYGDGLQGFAVAGKDGKYHWAKAVIDGDSVVVSSSDVPRPVAVQYAWDRNAPWANLFNKDGLPALIFREGG
jgi:sialate O-acetylesterase